MKTFVLSLALLGGLVAAPRLARADGWIHCSGPDSSCNASGADSASVGAGLFMIGAVAYGLTRRRKRR
jgi:MYXO-CTERM domain-containing protein